MSVQFILKEGQPEYAIMPYADYSQLLMNAEMVADVRAYNEVKRKIATGETELVPERLLDALIDGEHPIKVWREYRGLTQQTLAEQAGISTAYLSQLETGKRSGTVDVLKRVARALAVSLEDVIELDEE